MQKHLQKLLLLLAFLVPWVANAQTLTVANGTATNTYVPIYGYYCDEDQHNQHKEQDAKHGFYLILCQMQIGKRVKA